MNPSNDGSSNRAWPALRGDKYAEMDGLDLRQGRVRTAEQAEPAGQPRLRRSVR
jgi:hypothetical protein